MTFNISDNSEIDIYITDGWREWYIPKFRLRWTIDNPNITLYWTDTENPGNGITRSLTIDYNDVLFGYITPSSAFEIQTVLNSYIVSAWDNIYLNFQYYVPYTGATNNVDLGGYGLNTDFVAFSLNPFNSPAPGQIAYDGSTGSLTYMLNNSNVESNIGQTLHAYVHNAEGSTIYKGDAVYLYQATGNKASVKLAKNTSDQYSAKTLGLCAEDIGAGQNGMVICQGQIKGVDTSLFSEGDTLYLANTFGDLTNVKPYAPEHLVYIGVVEKANANGEIYVRPQNGYELAEIHDVDLITTPPIAGDVLTYDGSLWIAQAPSSGSGITSLNSETGTSQTFATGSSGTDFNIASATNVHTFNIPTASATNRGLLSTSDWSTFNSKEPALTKGNLTEATSSILTISGGTNAVIGTGTTIQVAQANGSQSGYLASADWTTFNGKQDLLVSGTNIKTINGTSILGSGSIPIPGYTLSVQALTSSPVDAQTIYFGNLPKAPVTTANISKVYIPKSGTIKRAEIYCYSGTAGTNQAWSGYIRLNNLTDTLIQTLSVATNERVFSNSSLSIVVVAGDYIEIKFINPTWATNPLTTIFGGYIYIE
jgi:hypothetical protein